MSYLFFMCSSKFCICFIFICCSDFLYAVQNVICRSEFLYAVQIFYMLFTILYAVQNFYMLFRYFICCSQLICCSKFLYAVQIFYMLIEMQIYFHKLCYVIHPMKYQMRAMQILFIAFTMDGSSTIDIEFGYIFPPKMLFAEK